MGLGHFRQLRPPGRLTPRQRTACALLALLTVVLSPTPAFAQYTGSDTETVDARAAILTPGSMAKLTDMDFGDIAQPSSPGTVVLTPTPTPTCGTTGGLVRTGDCQAASFAILKRGNGNNPVRIRELNNGQIVLLGPGGASMTVTNLTLSVTDLTTAPGGGPQGTMGNYRFSSSDGFASFRIGGTLHVAAQQPGGHYSGTLELEVQLN